MNVINDELTKEFSLPSIQNRMFNRLRILRFLNN